MKQVSVVVAFLIVVFLAFGVGAGVVLALVETPPFQIVWSGFEENQQGPENIYVLVDNGQLCCGCPCDGCETASVAGESPTSVPPTQPPPDGTQPPPPTATNIPPTLEPTPTSTPVPESGKCNQGRGNGDEGCDPGNSNNNQDSNDEPGVRGK